MIKTSDAVGVVLGYLLVLCLVSAIIVGAYITMPPSSSSSDPIEGRYEVRLLPNGPSYEVNSEITKTEDGWEFVGYAYGYGEPVKVKYTGGAISITERVNEPLDIPD